MTAPGRLRGVERPVGLVGAIGEPFRRDAQARRPRPRRSSASSGSPNMMSDGSHARDRARDRVGQRAVARRHVVERAVRLDVLERASPSACAIAVSAPICAISESSSSARSTFISRRPNPCRSANPGMRADAPRRPRARAAPSAA